MGREFPPALGEKQIKINRKKEMKVSGCNRTVDVKCEPDGIGLLGSLRCSLNADATTRIRGSEPSQNPVGAAGAVGAF